METIVSQNKLITDGQLDLRVAHNIFDLAMSINPSIEIYLHDILGNILSYSAPNGKFKRNSIDLTALQRFIDTPKILRNLGLLFRQSTLSSTGGYCGS